MAGAGFALDGFQLGTGNTRCHRRALGVDTLRATLGGASEGAGGRHGTVLVLLIALGGTASGKHMSRPRGKVNTDLGKHPRRSLHVCLKRQAAHVRKLRRRLARWSPTSKARDSSRAAEANLRQAHLLAGCHFPNSTQASTLASAYTLPPPPPPIILTTQHSSSFSRSYTR